MIKKTVHYTDFNDMPQTRDLYFHVSKNELIDNLDLQEELESMQQMLSGDERELERHEVQKMIDLIRRLFRISYGERSEDGQNFRKSDAIWEKFASSPAYDECLFEMFQNPEEAFQFMSGIMPKDLAQQAMAEAEARQDSRPVPQDRLPKQVSEAKSMPAFEEVEPPQEDLEHDPNGPSQEEIQAQIKKLQGQLEQ